MGRGNDSEKPRTLADLGRESLERDGQPVAPKRRVIPDRLRHKQLRDLTDEDYEEITRLGW